jgi:predicted Mrr-cat superfamily restriction endonuclease
MERTTIIIYIDNRPYRFQIEIDHKQGITSYYVSPDGINDITFVPNRLQFDENGIVVQKELLKTVEQEQIARLIWQEILNKLKP